MNNLRRLQIAHYVNSELVRASGFEVAEQSLNCYLSQQLADKIRGLTQQVVNEVNDFIFKVDVFVLTPDELEDLIRHHRNESVREYIQGKCP